MEDTCEPGEKMTVSSAQAGRVLHDNPAAWNGWVMRRCIEGRGQHRYHSVKSGSVLIRSLTCIFHLKIRRNIYKLHVRSAVLLTAHQKAKLWVSIGSQTLLPTVTSSRINFTLSWNLGCSEKRWEEVPKNAFRVTFQLLLTKKVWTCLSETMKCVPGWHRRAFSIWTIWMNKYVTLYPQTGDRSIFKSDTCRCMCYS